MMRIGVIAEELNDVEVLYEFTAKLIRRNSFSFSRFVGHGCGTLRRKCGAWATNLLTRGCAYLVVIHDLDDRKEKELRSVLESQIQDLDFKRTVVLIPIEEIEAWLLADSNALRSVFRMRTAPAVPRNPETITNPKEHLAGLVSRNSKTRYVNTIHNRKIAAAIQIELVKDRCPSFARYPQFLTKKPE